VKPVFQRELRWARTIRYNRGAQYYTMVFCYGTVYCLPLLLIWGFAKWAIALSLTTWFIRYAQVLVSIFSFRCSKLLKWLWALPLRDLLSLVVWAMGAFGQGVYWHGRRVRVIGDSLITQWE
jgi:ceramide glucosyltransferase